MAEATAAPGADGDWTATRCVCTQVRRIDRALTRLYDEALRPSGLTTTQYALLSTLRRAPAGLSLTRLADAMALDRTTLSRCLALLAEEGLVRLGPGDDRRTRHAGITPAGAERYAAARPLWLSTQERITAEGGAEVGALIGQLSDLLGPTLGLDDRTSGARS